MDDVAGAGPPLRGRALFHQWWRDVTFVHWRVDPDLVAPMLPPGTRPDLHDGTTWVGLIPFTLTDGAFGRSGPPVPWLGTFLETNVRLYSVDDAGRHGVVFRSLEAERLAMVVASNLSLGIPYRWAGMRRGPARPDPLPADPAGTRVAYRSRRRTTSRTSGRAASSVVVEVGDRLEPGPLELWLTARFGAHTRAWGRTLWVPNTHAPWPLRRARLVHLDDELVAAAGLPGVAASGPDSVLFSPGVHTHFGTPVRVC